jgi:hypothetical protein
MHSDSKICGRGQSFFTGGVHVVSLVHRLFNYGLSTVEIISYCNSV